MARHRSPRSLVHKLETSTQPLKTLEAVKDLRDYLDQVEATGLREARDAGASVSDIAEALGITRQGAHQKLKRLETREPARAEAEDTIVVPDLEPEHE
jgi:DNA-binding MarR family transcriptional regulator